MNLYNNFNFNSLKILKKFISSKMLEKIAGQEVAK